MSVLEYQRTNWLGHVAETCTVVYFMSDIAKAKEELGTLLDGHRPNSSSSWSVGTMNYAHLPQAIILGSAYHREIRDDLRQFVLDGKHRGVPWIVSSLDEAQSLQAKKERVVRGTQREYAFQVAQKIKAVLHKGLMEDKSKTDSLYFYDP